VTFFIGGGSDLDERDLQEFSVLPFESRLRACIDVSRQVFVTVDSILYSECSLPLSLELLGSIWYARDDSLRCPRLGLTIVITKMDLLVCACDGDLDAFSERMGQVLEFILSSVRGSRCWSMISSGAWDFSIVVGSSTQGVFVDIDAIKLPSSDGFATMLKRIEYDKLYHKLIYTRYTHPHMIFLKPEHYVPLGVRRNAARLISMTLLPRFYNTMGSMFAMLLFALSELNLEDAVEVEYRSSRFSISPKRMMIGGNMCERACPGAVVYVFLSPEEGLSAASSLQTIGPPGGWCAPQFVPYPYRSELRSLLLAPTRLARAAILVSLGFCRVCVRRSECGATVYAQNEEEYNEFYRMLHVFSSLTFGEEIGAPPCLYAISPPVRNSGIRPEKAAYYELDEEVAAGVELSIGLLATPMREGGKRGPRILLGELVGAQSPGGTPAALERNRERFCDVCPGWDTDHTESAERVACGEITELDSCSFLVYLQAPNVLAVDATLCEVQESQSSLSPEAHAALARLVVESLSQAYSRGTVVTDACLRFMHFRLQGSSASLGPAEGRVREFLVRTLETATGQAR